MDVSKRNLRKLMAFLMVFVLMMSTVGPAFAAGNDGSNATSTTLKSELTVTGTAAVDDDTVTNGSGAATVTVQTGDSADIVNVAVVLTAEHAKTIGGEPQNGDKDGTQNYHLTIPMTGLTTDGWVLVTGGTDGGQYGYDNADHHDWNVAADNLMLWLPVADNGSCKVVLRNSAGDKTQVVQVTTTQAEYTHVKADFLKEGALQDACQTTGCDYTLAAFQAACKDASHPTTEKPGTCSNCGLTIEATNPESGLVAGGTATIDNDTVKNGTGAAVVTTEGNVVKVAVTLTSEPGKTIGGDPQEGQPTGTPNYHLTIPITGLTTADWKLVTGVGNQGGQYGYDDAEHPEWNVAADNLMLWLPVTDNTCKVVLQNGTGNSAKYQIVEVTTVQVATPAHPVGYTHVFADFELVNGVPTCTKCGETITMVEYQRLHTPHTWAADKSGVCEVCGIACPNTSNHNSIVAGETCETSVSWERNMFIIGLTACATARAPARVVP